MQSHLRSWIINRKLQVVFSTSCMKFVEWDQQPLKTICSNCKKVVGSDALKQALRVKPPPLEAMKFIPIKYWNVLADLGTKFAHIQGLSELLQEVGSLQSSHCSYHDQHATGPSDLNLGAVCSQCYERRIQ